MPQQQKILVVDDDPNIAQLIRLYLEKEGYQVTVEGRGDTAVAAFRKDPPHLMILDIMLPGMDGWQVCRTVRQSSNIPIIMLSAKDETFDKVLGLELGADDYMVKRFEMKELIPRSSLWIFEESNHYPFLEEKQAFEEAVSFIVQGRSFPN